VPERHGATGAAVSEAAVRLAALSVPRHACRHCSACCASFRVGPLLEDDVRRVEAAVPTVLARFPDQQVDGAIRVETWKGGEQRFLGKRGGRCVFWRDGTGCTIHASAGSTEKPLVCQLFPLQAVRDGDTVRLGTRPTCLADWANAGAPPIDAVFIEQIARSPQGAVPRPKVDGEDLAMQVLSLPDASTTTVFAMLGRQKEPVEPESVEPWLAHSLDALIVSAHRLREQLPDEQRGPLHENTVTFAQWSAVEAWWRARGHRGLPVERETYARYGADVLKRLVYLRQTTLFPSSSWALLLYAAAIRWAAAYAEDGGEPVGCPGDGSELARFGPVLATLLQLTESPALQAALRDGGPPFR
jgi:Fe-S-cluster containining protein